MVSDQTIHNAFRIHEILYYITHWIYIFLFVFLLLFNNLPEPYLGFKSSRVQDWILYSYPVGFIGPGVWGGGGV